MSIRYRLLGEGLAQTLAPGGTLVVSGILAEQAMTLLFHFQAPELMVADRVPTTSISEIRSLAFKHLGRPYVMGGVGIAADAVTLQWPIAEAACVGAPCFVST